MPTPQPPDFDASSGDRSERLEPDAGQGGAPPPEGPAAAAAADQPERTYGARRRKAEELAKSLTPRQRDVLARLLRGESVKEIATGLGISQYTVSDHVKELHQHFGVSSRGELLALFVPTWY